MAQPALPAWVNKTPSEATDEEKRAFVDSVDKNPEATTEALRQNKAWARVADHEV